ncbi:hypothetical protein HER39_20595, partial [Arthrobacter deserti]|nr:hypothetical protein [Arthrobacter deserti]
QHVLGSYFAEACTVQIRGSAATAGVPYGALGFLVSELEDEVLGHPLLVLQSVARLLDAHAGGRPIVLLVDHAEELDPMSAAVVTQLARSGAAKIVAGVSEAGGAADQLVRMWSEGRLMRLDVDNFDLEESAGFIGFLLGGRVSRAAAGELWSMTGGNPLALRLLAIEQRNAGTL